MYAGFQRHKRIGYVASAKPQSYLEDYEDDRRAPV
jgi:hypothetical protein